MKMYRHELERALESRENAVFPKQVSKKRGSWKKRLARTLIISSLFRVGWSSKDTLLAKIFEFKDAVNETSGAVVYDTRNDKRMNKDEIVVQEYIVKKGDTLWDLAQAYNATVEEILYYNPKITNENLINISEDIIIPIK